MLLVPVSPQAGPTCVSTSGLPEPRPELGPDGVFVHPECPEPPRQLSGRVWGGQDTGPSPQRHQGAGASQSCPAGPWWGGGCLQEPTWELAAATKRIKTDAAGERLASRGLGRSVMCPAPRGPRTRAAKRFRGDALGS